MTTIINYEDFLNLKIISNVDTDFLNIPNHPKIPYLSSIKILTNNFKLQKIKDIIDFWKEKNYEDEDLNDINWMYIYCMKYGFLNKLDTKNINIYGSWEYTNRKYNLNMEQADEYLKNLEPMSDKNIETFCKVNPFNIFKDGKLDDGTHRCCSMIGRIIRNEKYINLYVNYI